MHVYLLRERELLRHLIRHPDWLASRHAAAHFLRRGPAAILFPASPSGFSACKPDFFASVDPLPPLASYVSVRPSCLQVFRRFLRVSEPVSPPSKLSPKAGIRTNLQSYNASHPELCFVPSSLISLSTAVRLLSIPSELLRKAWFTIRRLVTSALS